MPVRPMLLHRTALVSFRLLCKNLGNLQEFLGKWFIAPWRKIARTPGIYNLSYSDPGGVLFIRNKEHYVSKEIIQDEEKRLHILR